MAQLLSNLPVGAKVKFGTYNNKPLSWLKASTDGTMILEYVIPDRAFDATEKSMLDGQSRYDMSNIRQWLNSDVEVWYSPVHDGDLPPDYESAYGFLYYFSADEKNALQVTTIKTKERGALAGSYTVEDRVFLPSIQDVSTNQYAFDESTLLPLFGTPTSCIATTNGTTKYPWWLRTAHPDEFNQVMVIDKSGNMTSSYPDRSGYGVRPCVRLFPQIKASDTTDSVGYYTIVYNTAPFAPTTLTASIIYGGKSNPISWTKVTDPDGDEVTYQLECSIDGGEYTQIYSGAALSYAHLVPFGTSTVSYRVKATDPSGESSAYTESATITVVNNNAPVISGVDYNRGVESSGFTGTYTITDANSDTVTVTEAIDGVQIRALVATLGEEITYGVTGNTWLALPNGSHTLTIRATDGIDTTVRTYTFTKLVEKLVIQNSTPWFSTTMPTRIMLVITRNIPSGATFKVEVCNNGCDVDPIWEDCTDAVKSGLVHVFTNTEAQDTGRWGVLVRVTVERNGATGACYVSAIGGNFE